MERGFTVSIGSEAISFDNNEDYNMPAQVRIEAIYALKKGLCMLIKRVEFKKALKKHRLLQRQSTKQCRSPASS
jgi:hypothetical protein